jgi:hypothetical protein
MVDSNAEGGNTKPMNERGNASPTTRIQIFRRAEARSLADSGMMTLAASKGAQFGAMGQPVPERADMGARTDVLFANSRFSLVYLWYKSGVMLPQHSHNVDCLYLIIGGSLKLGTEVLEPGDGFFVGADVPYAWSAGDLGVEVLEFRGTDCFDVKLLAGETFWQKAAQTARDRQEAWQLEIVSPTGLTTPTT